MKIIIRAIEEGDIDAVCAMDKALEKVVVCRMPRMVVAQSEVYIAVTPDEELKAFICVTGNRLVKAVSDGGLLKHLIDHVRQERADENGGETVELTAMCRERLCKFLERQYSVERRGIRPNAYGIGEDGIEIIIKK